MWLSCMMGHEYDISQVNAVSIMKNRRKQQTRVLLQFTSIPMTQLWCHARICHIRNINSAEINKGNFSYPRPGDKLLLEPKMIKVIGTLLTLQWRHNGSTGVSNHQPHDCLLNRLFRCRSKKTTELRVTGLCAGNSSVTGEFPTQRASNAEDVSIWWRQHD